MSTSALTPTPQDELQRERIVLATAERHLTAGNDRVLRQQALVRGLQDAGHEDSEAKRYLELLNETMREWKRHHQLIVERLLYLERKADHA